MIPEAKSTNQNQTYFHRTFRATITADRLRFAMNFTNKVLLFLIKKKGFIRLTKNGLRHMENE